MKPKPPVRGALVRQCANSAQHEAVLIGFPSRAARETARLAADLVRAGVSRGIAISRAQHARRPTSHTLWTGGDAA